MTSSIKPPGSRPPGGALGADPRGPVEGGSKVGRGGPGFQEVVGASRPEAAAPLQPTRSAERAGAVESVRAALSSGGITASEAVERLVQRALQRPDVQALPAAARAELEAVLRHALSDDPNLSSLVRDLDR